MKKVLLDTNVLLDNPYFLEEEGYQFYLPQVVLQELDGLKRNEQVGYNARLAIKLIYSSLKKDKLQIITTPTKENNDDIILNVAKNLNIPVVSNDIGLLTKAHHYGIETMTNNNIKTYDKNFKGYYKVTLPDDYYSKTFYSLSEFQHCEIEEFLIEPFEVPINSYLLIYPESDTESYCQIVRKTKEKYYKIDTSKKILKGLGIKGAIDFDEEVSIAIDMILNETLFSVLDGSIGSGKTLTAVLGSLIQTIGSKKNRKYEKIYITRPPIPIDKSLEIGFLKGGLDEKMGQWLLGFKNALSYLFQDEDKVNELFNSIFQIISLESIQGASLHNSILVVDEAQFLSTDMTKQVMSRVADTSKLIFCLDPNQNYGIFRGREGYSKLLPYCKGNELISYIKLSKVRRSALTELAMRIFD